MQRVRYYYLIKMQYLGYRLHGWQKQPNLKTAESLIKKTLDFVLPERKFKILGSSRTDAMVSANETAFELFLSDAPLDDIGVFLELFNRNLPPDIKALEITEVDADFNIIKNPTKKQYCYLFSFGEKNHPFCAPLMANIQEPLDVELMMIGAKCFEGTHYFKNYCVRPSENGKFKREIIRSEITRNTLYTASFFPENSFMYTVEGSGFLRNQIRLMMGTLFQLGKREIQLNDIEESLKPGNDIPIEYVAPASGLILNRVEFE